MCGWRSERTESKLTHLLDWSIEHNGGTAVMRNERQKLVDRHNDPNGYYACVYVDEHVMHDYGFTTVQGRMAHLLSSLFDPTPSKGQCFTFYYFVYGNDSGALNLWQETTVGDSYSSRSIWRRGASLNNEWKKGLKKDYIILRNDL